MAESKREANWTNKLEQVREFAQNRSRWPSTTAKDDEERKLGQWWSRSKYQLGKLRRGEEVKLSEDRGQQIENLISSFEHLERDGVWMSRFSAVQDQVSANGRLWSYKTQDAEELQNLRWWNQQKTFFKKLRESNERIGGMTEDRAELIQTVLDQLNESGEENEESANTEASVEAATS